MVAILVLLTIITCLTIDYLHERAALRRAARAGETQPETRPVPEPALKVPKGVFIGPAHIRMELDPGGAVLHHEEEAAPGVQEEKEPDLVERF